MISEVPKIELVGFHRDTKPCGDQCANGTKLTEVDTGEVHYYDTEKNVWVTHATSVESIAITTPPTATTYTLGGTLSLTGMVVTATYSNGDTKVVTNEVTTSPASGATLTTDDTEITVSYEFNFETVTATQAITVTEAGG